MTFFHLELSKSGRPRNRESLPADIAAVARARDLVRRHPYFWKGDVRRYFDSVSHSTLARMLASLVPDERILELLLLILAHQPPGAVPGRGIPIGNLTSQHFANLYLGARDRFRRGWETRLSNHRSGRLSEERFLASAASATGHVIHASTLRLRTQVLEAASSVG